MPQCQYCGQDIGNAGALSQHEAACDQNPANQDGSEQLPAQQTQPAGGAQLQRQQQNPGAGIADTLFVLANFDEMPTDTRRAAVQQSAGMLGGMLNRYLDLREKSLERQEHRARNAELSPIEELPTCPECDYQFSTDEVKRNEVRCPDCNRLYSVEVRAAE